jgi:hypothetical protein
VMRLPACAAAFSLSRALQLGLPAHVAAIEEVSEYASKVNEWLVLCRDAYACMQACLHSQLGNKQAAIASHARVCMCPQGAAHFGFSFGP